MLVYTSNYYFHSFPVPERPFHYIKDEVYWGDNCEFAGRVLAIASTTPDEFQASGEAAGISLLFINNAIGSRRFIYQIHLTEKSAYCQEYALAWVDESLLVSQEEGIRCRENLEREQGLKSLASLLQQYQPKFKQEDWVEFAIHSPIDNPNYVLFRERGQVIGMGTFSCYEDVRAVALHEGAAAYASDFIAGHYYKIEEQNSSFIAWVPESILKFSPEPPGDDSQEHWWHKQWEPNLNDHDTFLKGMSDLAALADPSSEKEELGPLFAPNDWAVVPIDDSMDEEWEVNENGELVPPPAEEEVLIRDFIYLDERLETYLYLIYVHDYEDHGVRWERIHDAEQRNKGIVGWLYMVEPFPVGRSDYVYWTTESELTKIQPKTSPPKGEMYNALALLENEILEHQAVFDMSVQLPLSMVEIFKESLVIPFTDK